MFWFEDAYQDISKLLLRKDIDIEDFESYLNDTLKAEEQSWQTFQAPVRGRYLFGRSLLKYQDDRNCEDAGIVNCVCKEKSDVHKLYSNIG